MALKFPDEVDVFALHTWIGLKMFPDGPHIADRVSTPLKEDPLVRHQRKNR